MDHMLSAQNAAPVYNKNKFVLVSIVMANSTKIFYYICDIVVSVIQTLVICYIDPFHATPANYTQNNKRL